MPFRALITTIKTGGLFLSALSFGIIEIHFLPAPGKVFILAAAMFIDLCTGLLKAWKNGHVTRSRGFKQSAIKFGTYSAIIVSVSLLANVMGDIAPGVSDWYGYIVTGMVGFLTFVEIYSIFENIYEMAPDSFLSVYIAGPVLKWMKGIAERNNPITHADGEPTDGDTDGDT